MRRNWLDELNIHSTWNLYLPALYQNIVIRQEMQSISFKLLHNTQEQLCIFKLQFWEFQLPQTDWFCITCRNNVDNFPQPLFTAKFWIIEMSMFYVLFITCPDFLKLEIPYRGLLVKLHQFSTEKLVLEYLRNLPWSKNFICSKYTKLVSYEDLRLD